MQTVDMQSAQLAIIWSNLGYAPPSQQNSRSLLIVKNKLIYAGKRLLPTSVSDESLGARPFATGAGPPPALAMARSASSTVTNLGFSLYTIHVVLVAEH